MNDKGNIGAIIPIILIGLVIFGLAVFGPTILSKTSENYQPDNTTSLGKTAEANSDIMAMVMNIWPLLGILVLLLIVVIIGAWFIKTPGGMGR